MLSENDENRVINLDSPLIGSIEGQIEMCACTDFEEWAAWLYAPSSLQCYRDLPCSNLRNPPDGATPDDLA